MEVSDKAKALLKGAYDLHIHPIPSHVERLMDDNEILLDAEKAGMDGVLLKNHYEPTGARAVMANRTHPECRARAYGAAALNWPLGGLNPMAAASALRMGAKILFMPTRDAANCLLYGDMPGDFFKREGISVLDSVGRLKPEIYAIFDVVKEYDALLATGHISPKEAEILCEEGRRYGVPMILTHPEWERTVVSAEMQVKLAQIGVYIEKCWYNIAEGNCTAKEMAEHIRAVGAEHCFLSTDRGQAGKETPAEGMARFVQTLLDEGFSEKEIHMMAHEVPAKMLGMS